MPVSSAYRPDPHGSRSWGPSSPTRCRPRSSSKHILRFRNDRAAASVGLDTLTDEEWIAHFGRFEPLPGNIDPPLAQRYHGHQFRVYNPDLGDGRGFTFAQMREAGAANEGGARLLDLGTKGSGQTPWSRTADGRLTLKGGMREVLATAMLEALGVPTSRSFSLVARDRRGSGARRRAQPDPLGRPDAPVAQPHPLRQLPAPRLFGAPRPDPRAHRPRHRQLLSGDRGRERPARRRCCMS